MSISPQLSGSFSTFTSRTDYASVHAALKGRLLRVAEQNVGQSDVWACLGGNLRRRIRVWFPGDATSLIGHWPRDGARLSWIGRTSSRSWSLPRCTSSVSDSRGFVLRPSAEWLSSRNTDAIGILGLQIVHTGQFERGTTIVRRAMELNPNHAGWMHFAPLWDHFHKGEYEQALECANRVDVPGRFWAYLVMASACGHLGRRTEAEAAVKDCWPRS